MTQARAKARALVGAVLSGSTIGLALFAAVQLNGASEPVAPVQADTAPPAAEAAVAPKVIKAGILPEFTSSAATLLAVDPFRGAPSRPHGAANARDLKCLTEAVYFESRGQPRAGQEAVAQVVLNRTRHPAYPKTVCGVTYQGRERGSCQFSYACHHRVARRESADWRLAAEIAQAALDGSARDVVGTATSFHATRVRPGWGGMIRVSTLGDHVFYRFAGAKGAPTTFSSAPQPSRAGGVGSLGSALMAAAKRPMQALTASPAVQTVTPPPAPVLALTAAPSQAPALETATDTPVVTPSVDAAVPVQAATLQPVSTPVDAAAADATVAQADIS